MSDRRLTPANDRVAHERLRGTLEGPRFVTPLQRAVRGFSAFLHAAPHGARDRELVHGDRFDVLEERAGWAFGQAVRDGYVGYVESTALGLARTPTHAVAVRQSHLYSGPEMKRPPVERLPFGAVVTIVSEGGGWAATARGSIPSGHLRRLDAPLLDPVAVAERFLGTPYLWAGNTGDGIDCSGLVQAACLACGIPCPGDSDLQEVALGAELPPDADLRRGDLLFWAGHVAWVADPVNLLHANAHSMSVTYEGIDAAIARIAAQGGGAVTARRRPTP